MTQKTVVALIVNFNGKDQITACVESLLATSCSHIVVLDNASTDAISRRAVTELVAVSVAKPGRLKVFESNVNIGFGAGINRCAELAPPADFLWMVNPDSTVAPSSADELVAAMEQAGLGLASPLISTGETSEALWFAGGELDRRRGLSRHLTELKSSDHVLGCTFLTGAALCIRRDVWIQLGGFDESLFLYWEDADLTWRANSTGVLAGLAPRAMVWHARGGSAEGSGSSEIYYYYMHRNRLLTCGDSNIDRLSLAAGRGARFTIRLLRASIREDEQPTKKTLYSLLGILHGLLGRRSNIEEPTIRPVLV